ncbi:MerR family transcriptional regulator [Enterococcus raffinosus]|uniref:MerR family transcriptional regulator n=1 Tax=Enterococcus TaxID=1350 RepID=UPI001C47BDE6|nr:MerR family transcriptional regulator [Enterococcus raffinosus]MDT2574044.1 MerR family transcriptional regulator [Enterococcus raffinosus]QXJ59190.1 MerR family transcriptional regulator [Enterococcus raffinosus]
MKNNTVKQLLESDDLLVGISELSKVTGVSPRQIRYWEQKGFISSTGEKSGNRKFKLPMVIKVEIIKHFLDEGYTLTAAVNKAQERQNNIHQAKVLLREIFKDIQQVGERYLIIRLDNFENKEGFYLIRDTLKNKVTYQIVDADSEITTDLLEKWF